MAALLPKKATDGANNCEKITSSPYVFIIHCQPAGVTRVNKFAMSDSPVKNLNNRLTRVSIKNQNYSHTQAPPTN